MPPANGASGPTTVKWIFSSLANEAKAFKSVTLRFSMPMFLAAAVAVPPLPGATNTFCTFGD